MSRDYAKKSSSRRSKHAVPGWVWMMIGLLVGLFVAFLMYLNQANLKPTQWEMPALLKDQQGADKKQAAASTDKASEQAKVNFDFYNMLPEFEVPVPDSPTVEPPAPRPTPVNTPEPTSPAAQADTPEPPQPVTQPFTVAAPEAYIIQAGSFSNAKDADTRRAQLALLGIISKVQKVTIDGSKIYHRVRVGPYQDMERLNKVRALLKENSIEFMLVKQRG